MNINKILKIDIIFDSLFNQIKNFKMKKEIQKSNSEKNQKSNSEKNQKSNSEMNEIQNQNEIKKISLIFENENKIIISKKEINMISNENDLIKLSKIRFIDHSSLKKEMKDKLFFHLNFEKEIKNENQRFFISQRSSNNNHLKESIILSKISSMKKDDRINDYYLSLISYEISENEIKKISFKKLSKNLIRMMNDKEIEKFIEIEKKYQIQENDKKISKLKELI